MQNLELQELMLEALGTDIGYLEHFHEKELREARNLCVKKERNM